MALDTSGKNFGSTVGKAVTSRLGGEWTPEKARFFEAWARAEGTTAEYNPFATTRKGYSGETQFNSVGVKNYPSLAIGIQATYDTLQNGYYNHIVDLLRDPSVSAEDLAVAVSKSPWGTGTGVLRVLGADPAAYEQATDRQAILWNAMQAKTTDQEQKTIDTETYGRLRADYEVAYRQFQLRPSEGYLAQLRQRSPFGARLAGISERAFEGAEMPTPPTPPTEPVPEETSTPTEKPTTEKTAQFTPVSNDTLSMAVGGADYRILDTPEGHQKRPLGNWESDNAYDLGVPVGTPIYALTDGTVGENFGVQPTRPKDGARLEIGGRWYGHLSRIVVKPGDRVKRGQLIGYSGTSQNGVPHLHVGFKP